MTEVDETMLTAAKMAEQVRGSMESKEELLPHAGLVEDREDRNSLSFLQETMGSDVDLVQEVTRKLATESASKALFGGNATVLANYVGVTEADLDGSEVVFPIELNKRMDNNGATAFIIAVGNPNTGKTNTCALLAELRQAALDDLQIISNVRSWDLTDTVVTSAHDLAVTLLENRDRPKYVLLDEASTHLDARTYSREVATQFTPLAKRFAKLDVDTFAAVGHTGKDVHPEAKRLCTTAVNKLEKKEIELYSTWPADADAPKDRLFGGSIENLQAASSGYDQDDAAPWSWDLEPELFAKDLDWSELLEELKQRGPAE